MENSKTSSSKRKKKQEVTDEGLSEVSISAVQVLLKVYLWTGEGSEAPQSAFAMLDDLFSTSPCEVCERSSLSIAASFSDTAQAVNAARRLWRLMQGFFRASKTGSLGGCFTLSNVGDVNEEAETRFLEQLPVLTRIHSGQLYFIGGLCEPARTIPGLRFEAVSVEYLTPGTNRSYPPFMELMPPVQMEGFSEEPVGCWAPAVECRAQVVGGVHPAASSLEAEAPVEQIGVVVDMSNSADTRSSSTSIEEIAPFPRMERISARKLPLRWAIFGCATVVTLAAIVILIPHSKKSQSAATPSVVVAPAATPRANVTVPLPTAPLLRGPNKLTIPAKPRAQGNSQDSTSHKPKIIDPGQNQAMDEVGSGTLERKKSGAARTDGVIFTAGEIDPVIKLADRDSGNGKFDKAIREYQTALKVDPSNTRAREGLARAIKNRKHK